MTTKITPEYQIGVDVLGFPTLVQHEVELKNLPIEQSKFSNSKVKREKVAIVKSKIIKQR